MSDWARGIVKHLKRVLLLIIRLPVYLFTTCVGVTVAAVFVLVLAAITIVLTTLVSATFCCTTFCLGLLFVFGIITQKDIEGWKP